MIEVEGGGREKRVCAKLGAWVQFHIPYNQNWIYTYHLDHEDQVDKSSEEIFDDSTNVTLKEFSDDKPLCTQLILKYDSQ